MTDTYFRSKVTLIQSRLSEIKKRQFEHQRQSVRLGYLHRYSKATVHALNAVSMTSLIVTMLGTASSLIICAVAGGLSAIGTAVLEVLDIHDRHINHHHSYLPRKPDNRKLASPCQLICKIMHAVRETLVSYYRVFPVQLLDLYNDISANMLHEGVTSAVLDTIIDDLNHRSALLYENAPLIGTQSMVSSVALPRWSLTASSRYRDSPKPLPQMVELDVCITHDSLLPVK
jgi:hypothetical protein